MIVILILCAVLSGITLAYIMAPKLRPKRGGRLALAGTFLLATAALALYLWAGNPDLGTRSPDQVTAEQLAAEESAIMDALEKNPDDAEALIRLAALQVYRTENDAETIGLLDRAEKQLPGDLRIKFIRAMIEIPNPEPRP